MTQKHRTGPANRNYSSRNFDRSQKGYTNDDVEHILELIYKIVEASSGLCRLLISLRDHDKPSSLNWTQAENTSEIREGEQLENHVSQQSSLWTIPQVCEALQLSRSKIYQLIEREGLPVLRFGRTVRVSPTELQQWLQQRDNSY